MVSVAPVTFGQLSVLRSTEFTGPRGESSPDLTLAFPLPDGMDLEQINGIWSEILRLNESLRTVYDRRPAEPLQIVQPVPDVKLGFVELPDDSSDAALEAAAEIAQEPFRIDVEHPCRAVIGTHKGMPRFLISVLHHMAVDHAACVLLEDQFNALAAGNELTPGPQPVQLALEQRSDLDQRQATIDYWGDAWDEFVEDDRIPGDTSRRLRADMYTKAGMEAANQIAARLNISVQSVILGAAALSLFRLKGRESITFGLISSNRFDRRWEKIVSSMNQLTPLTVSAAQGMRLEDFLRGTYLSSLDVYAYGCYDVDALRTALEGRGHQDPDPMNFNCFYNFLGDAGEAPSDGDPLLSTVVWRNAVRQEGPRFHLRVATGEGMHVVAAASHEYLPAELLAAFPPALEAALVHMASGTSGSIDEVDLTPRRPIPGPPAF
ncbi:condensation domain-containing protein [Streptomyces sp. NBC_01244]|uniref:condensation domain-containing protein n=1 Tax=Streptomyces sp. NBC_01244 TaxID=2903797 RepID=UPI002E0D6CBF|nr:condensation domain-containing protein [Streptomyces sp. NBC_01244]